MTRPIQASIDLGALRHNCSVARRYAGSSRIWAVLKANAYGHGLLRAAQALADSADGFALIEIEGAMALRHAGLRQPILLLEGFYTVDELPLIAEYRLTTVIHSLHQVQMLIASSLPDGICLPVYLKLNTGMNRLGLNDNELAPAIDALNAASHVGAITLMTHFADADGGSDGPGIAEQMGRLDTMRSALTHPVSLANSAAILRYPESLGGGSDWARAGIMLYGSSPFPDLKSADALDLEPVMTLTSELIAVRDLAPSDRIGYGGTFVADAPMKVGVVACGYADGYPRLAPTGTPILVNGQRSRTLGRVSMDKICVDLGGISGADVGSPVVLWGKNLSADEVAAAAGTISYELFCALAARVPVMEV
ncbi:MAG: alanine racemase [Proteobacteria bacterium]|nr:alanine racemase [Pseudomonadota bacterium]